MSESEGDSGPGQREVAYRLFATEFEDADFSYSESDEERAPNYVITPTGARANRVFVVGVLTEVEEVGEDVLRARVVDPTGAFVLYAGQYQPDEMAFLDRAETPSFVAVTGKARTFQPEDSNTVYTSIRPESISTVDAATRDRWTVQTAEQTLQRIEHMATALSLDLSGAALSETLEDHGVAESLAEGIPLAIEHYGTTPAYLAALRETALDAARVVSGEIDEVESLTVAPDATGDADLGALADASVDVTAAASSGTVAESAAETGTEAATTTDSAAAGSEAAATVDEASESAPDTTTEPVETDTEPESTASADAAEASGATEPTSETVQSSPATETEPETTSPTTSSTAETDTKPTTVDDSAAAEDDDLGDFEPGEFELDDDEREELEEEFGTEFQSGTDVPEPGESDIETPDPEELADKEAKAETEVEQPNQTIGGAAAETEDEPATATSGGETAAGDASETESAEPEPVESEETAAEPEPAEDVDVEDAVIDVMEELDDGDGAERTELVATVTERYGVSDTTVEDAIQDALMSGRCYEPDDSTLKSI
jgi:hypothetical protein